MRRLLSICLVMAIALVVSVGQVSASDDFPLRAKYPDVKPISTEDLASGFGDIIVVDVRSSMEFGVAHINDAKHVSLSKASFAKDLEAVRGKKDSKIIAFYCNGHTCSKSYKATKKAAEAGFTNIVAYDSGIFDWITANPDKATLMGVTPAAKDKIISKSDLNVRMLSFADLKAKAGEGNAMVIDIRDPFQRKVIPDIPKMRNIPLDRLLGLLKKKQFSDKNLLIIDAVGKQVRWLQYHLEANGYSNYAFLDKGVKGIK